MGKDVIIACDFNSKAEVIAFLEKFKDEKPFVKIGMELFLCGRTGHRAYHQGDGTQDLP